jgi:hypothetical protein
MGFDTKTYWLTDPSVAMWLWLWGSRECKEVASMRSCEIGSQRAITEAEDIVGIRYQATASEDIEDLVCAVLRNRLRKLVTALWVLLVTIYSFSIITNLKTKSHRIYHSYVLFCSCSVSYLTVMRVTRGIRRASICHKETCSEQHGRFLLLFFGNFVH